MNNVEMKAEVGRLLAERAEMKRLGLELSPDKLMLLKRLMYRLRMSNVKLARPKKNPLIEQSRKALDTSYRLLPTSTYHWYTDLHNAASEPIQHGRLAAIHTIMKGQHRDYAKFRPTDSPEYINHMAAADLHEAAENAHAEAGLNREMDKGTMDTDTRPNEMLPEDYHMSRRRSVLHRLARRFGVRRYAENEPVAPQPPAPSDPFDHWRTAAPPQLGKISTALKKLHEKAALVPVTDDPVPMVKRPQSAPSPSRGRGRRQVDDSVRNVPGGFALHTRSGRRDFRDYLSNTGEDSDFNHRVQEWVQSDVQNYEPEIDNDRLREAAVENEWTPDVMAETIAEQHPEAAEAVHGFNRIHSYRPRADQPTLFDPHEGQGWTAQPRSHISRFDPQDALADPDDTDYEDRLMEHLQTYHPDLDHGAINHTLQWLSRDRRNEMDSARDNLYDQERRWYEENYDTSEIENEVLSQMHDDFENEGRWEERDEPEEDEVQLQEPQHAQLPAAEPLQLTTPEPPKGPEDRKWYGDHAAHSYRFKTPSGRPFQIDIGHHNTGGNKIDVLTFNDDRHSYDDTGRGEAAAVFDHVASAVAAYMQKKKPHVLTFSAATTDGEATGGKSRQNLYAALIKRIAKMDPSYAAGAIPNASGGKNFFVFDRSKVDDAARHIDRNYGSQNKIEPIVLKRNGQPIRFAKIDGHVVAHPLVQGFPIETALRHLANDPENHPSIRELAKVAVTGGKNGDGSNIPTALWALHDELHEKKHPAKDWYNWMSAADSIGLDAHTAKALQEEADRTRYYAGTGVDDPNRNPWTLTPEHHASEAAMGVAATGSSHTMAHRIVMKDRIIARVKSLAPHAADKDIHQSIRRHAHRANLVWRQTMDNGDVEGENRIKEHDLVPLKKFDNMLGNGTHSWENEKATRYSRLLNRIRYALGEGRASYNPNGERMLTHEYDGGIAQIVPRNDGNMLHVHYLGPKDASPGEEAHFNTLGPSKLREMAKKLREMYPNSKYLTGLRPSGKRVMKDIAKLKRQGSPIRHQMVAGDFLQALQRIRSSDQQAVKHTTEQIAAKLGLKPASTVDALHDSPHYSAPGVAQAIYSNASPEAIHAAAAWYGLTGNIPGMAVFHVRPGGPDMLHRFRMQGSGHDLRARLDKAGLDSRVLVPHKTGFDVMIPDKGGAYRDRVKGFTQQQKTELQSSRGHFKTIGSSDQARAREMFRDAITAQEKATPQPERPTLRNRIKGMLVRMAKGKKGESGTAYRTGNNLPEGWITPTGKYIQNSRSFSHDDTAANHFGETDDPRQEAFDNGWLHIAHDRDETGSKFLAGFHPEGQWSSSQLDKLKDLAETWGFDEYHVESNGKSRSIRIGGEL